MSNDGETDPPPKAQSNRARQLFGHKGGAKPWESAVPGEMGSAPPPAAAPAAPPVSVPVSGPHSSGASAPYPRDAAYTPRPEASPEPEPSAIFGPVDEDEELTKLHPNYKFVMRVGAVITGLILMIAAIVVDEVISTETGFPFGFITGPAILFALFLIIRLPTARFNARGYQISRDRLRVVRGVMWHSDTIVPFGRVQHIDVDQGPIERAMGIATMTLHTAGSHNASVRLPGLGHELAVEMREEIRAHIKRETL